LEKTTPPGCDKSTSRWQTVTLLWSRSQYYSVIPGVFFICWSITISLSLIGSIKPTFVTAWHTRLTIKQEYTFSLKNKIFHLFLPLHFFVTFSKNFVPKKLTINHCLRKNYSSNQKSEQYFTGALFLYVIIKTLKTAVYSKLYYWNTTIAKGSKNA